MTFDAMKADEAKAICDIGAGCICNAATAALERAFAAGRAAGLEEAEGIAHEHRRLGERPAAVYRVAAAEIQQRIRAARAALAAQEKP